MDNTTKPDDLLAQIDQQLITDEQRQANYAKIKADAYMRWLGFYYLGQKEHSQHELRQKLLAKNCCPTAVEKFLQELIDEGYQSDERMTNMLIKESFRKGHGHQRILQNCKKKGLTTLKSSKDIDHWVNNHADIFGDEKADDDDINWLWLAIQTRVKKYGNTIPTDPKDKNKQLRFLQYRGFNNDICFQALKYHLDNYE